MQNYPALDFYIWGDSLNRLRSYCWETAPKFSVHPVGKTMHWIEIMLQPILVGLASSITMQSLGKIVLRAPAVGAKYGVCLPAGCREAANCRWTQAKDNAKKQGFRPAGAARYTHSRQTWPGRWARGSAWLRKISPQSAQDGNAAPKYQKFPLCSKESPRTGEPLDRFLKVLRTFIRPAILH